jgi:hypothetical protein
MPAKKTQPSKSSTTAKAKLEANRAQALARTSMLERFESEDGIGEKIISVLVEAMGAERAYLVKDGDSSHLEYEPDHTTRIKAVEVWLNRTMGLPVKREEKIHRTVTTDEDVQELLNTSEAFRETVEKMLDKAKTVADV